MIALPISGIGRLAVCFDQAAADPEVGVPVLTAACGEAFNSGVDLKAAVEAPDCAS